MHTSTPGLVPTLTLSLDPTIVEIDDRQLFDICQRNRDLRIERTAAGEILIMPPAGGKTSDRNSEINAQLRIWAKRDGRGRTFDSSGGFILPNGATRSPDAAWVELNLLRQLAPEEKERFLPLCPSFVIELRSPSDPLATIQTKMDEYIDNGTQLGWLIDPMESRVHVYRPAVAVEISEEPASIAGDPEMAGFVLELADVWNPTW